MDVTVLAAGGTIAMASDAGPVAPALDAGALAAVLDVPVRARTVSTKPSAQLSLADAIAIARAATEEAGRDRGVVVTHGTDTLEETAYLTDRLYDGEAPIVFTGAMRPASARGADGPANLADAVAVAGSQRARGLGVLIVFAGEIHAARDVRKVDSVSPCAFASPRLGPLGFVREDAVELPRRVERRASRPEPPPGAHVPIVPAYLGADERTVRAAAHGADGVVAVILGAGHTPPPFLRALRELAVPVIVTVRPERGAALQRTYGFEGSERDLEGLDVRADLSPQAARIELLCSL